MTILTYHESFFDVAQLLGATTFAADPQDPARYVFKDNVFQTVKATITFTANLSGIVTSALLEDAAGKDLISLTGLNKTVAEMQALGQQAVSGGDLYSLTVSLFDDDTEVFGTNARDLLETGLGNDTVTAAGGDDVIHKWGSGDLEVLGGGGTDTLIFQSFDGIVFPNFPSQGAVVDLTTGTGTTPWGGALTLGSVENVVGTFLADTLTGNAADNTFGDGLFDTGADVISGKGGNDRIWLSHQSDGATVDGGTGRDTLLFSTDALAVPLGGGLFKPGICRIDLLDPASNSGAMAGVTISGIEVFTASNLIATQSIFEFRGDNRDQVVTGVDEINGTFLPSGKDRLFGRGGDDVLNGLSARDLLNGGSGDDTLRGGIGADSLIGGDGSDLLIGGSGADQFIFTALSDSAVGAEDVISDFTAGKDIIDLSGIDAIPGGADDPLSFVGSITGAGQVAGVVVGGETQLWVNIGGSLAPEMVIRFTSGPVFTGADLVL